MTFSAWQPDTIAIVAYRWRGEWYAFADMQAIKGELHYGRPTHSAIDAQLHALPYTQVMLDRLAQRENSNVSHD